MTDDSEVGRPAALHPARTRLALALDVPTAGEALVLLRRLRPWFGVAKVGLELFVAEGPAVVTAVRDEGFEVFVDLKLHDIPTTVHNAARLVGALGATYLTIHAGGGRAMLRAGVKGFESGADAAGHGPPVTLGVTVLTSNAEASGQAFDDLVAVALAAGCPGLVCSALDVARARELHPAATLVVPRSPSRRHQPRRPGPRRHAGRRRARRRGPLGRGAGRHRRGRSRAGRRSHRGRGVGRGHLTSRRWSSAV